MREWKVVINFIGHNVYQVLRIKDTTKPMYSGNVEYSGGIFESRQAAYEYADKLNNR